MMIKHFLNSTFFMTTIIYSEKILNNKRNSNPNYTFDSSNSLLQQLFNLAYFSVITEYRTSFYLHYTQE